MVTGIGSVTVQQSGVSVSANNGSPIMNGSNGITNQNMQAVEPIKRPSDNRRSNKPIMEKRRRARINNCLNELKTLILDATKKDPARHSKLEKADILEKTVKHLQDLQRQQTAINQVADPNIINKFKAGFTECAKEVDRFPGIDPVVKRRLLQHLSHYLNGVKIDSQQQHLAQSQPNIQQVQIHMLPSSPPGSPDQTQLQPHQQIVQIAPTNGYYIKLQNGLLTYVTPHQIQATPATLPTLVPIPTRTSSTSSAASSTASTVYERISREAASCSPCYQTPPSPANSYEAMDYKQSSSISPLPHHYNSVQQHIYMEQPRQCYSPGPLSLVIKKSEPQDDEQPWRPW